MAETKKCPYCGQEIMAVAKKCRYCGKWLIERPIVEEPVHQNQKENDVALRLKERITVFLQSHQKPSKNVYLIPDIPQDVLDVHIKKYAKLEQNEIPLMVINKCSFGLTTTVPTSMVITDHNVYCRLLNDSFFTTFFPKLHFYKYNLNEIRNMSIGNNDHCFGSAYEGHQLIINDAIIGLLRMGTSLTMDEDMIAELNFIWASFKN